MIITTLCGVLLAVLLLSVVRRRAQVPEAIVGVVLLMSLADFVRGAATLLSSAVERRIITALVSRPSEFVFDAAPAWERVVSPLLFAAAIAALASSWRMRPRALPRRRVLAGAGLGADSDCIGRQLAVAVAATYAVITAGFEILAIPSTVAASLQFSALSSESVLSRLVWLAPSLGGLAWMFLVPYLALQRFDAPRSFWLPTVTSLTTGLLVSTVAGNLSIARHGIPSELMAILPPVIAYALFLYVPALFAVWLVTREHPAEESQAEPTEEDVPSTP
jgi:hypothetical protein